jgi:hypothetical protein
LASPPKAVCVPSLIELRQVGHEWLGIAGTEYDGDAVFWILPLG